MSSVIFKDILLFLILFQIIGDSNEDSLFFMGPGVFPETKTKSSISGWIFLSPEGAKWNGILAGFASYCIETGTSVDFQLWRPTSSSGVDFTLIASYSYQLASGTSVPSFQDIYIKDLGGQCAWVAKGDRVGIYFKDTRLPIPYQFVEDGLQESQKSLMLNPGPTEIIKPGYTAKVESLVFPYRFPIAAWYTSAGELAIFNSTHKQTPTCPENIKFPGWLATTNAPTTTTARTPPVGYTGNRGDKGPRGTQGPIGSTGAVGKDGLIGPTGIIGNSGAPGLPGDKGVVGATGQTGNTGSQGYTGATGSTGPTGPPGVRGPPGKGGGNATYKPNSTSTGDNKMPSAQLANEKWWRTQNLIKGLYAWSAILSFLAILTFVWVAVLCTCVVKKKMA